MTHLAAMEGAAPHFDRYSKASELTPGGDDWFRSYDQKTRNNAEDGCKALKEACEALFYRFEREHSFPRWMGRKAPAWGLQVSAPVIKTKAEQKLEWYESLRRPLTDAESVDLQRCLHAVYCYRRKYGVAA